MKLNQDQKFMLQDDDGNLILITEIEFDFNILQNKIIPMNGVRFNINFEDNTISTGEQVNIQTSFEIDGIYSLFGNED